MFTFQTTAILILNSSLQVIGDHIKAGTLDPKILDDDGNTLLTHPCIPYPEYELLVDSGCPVVNLNFKKMFTLCNCDNLKDYLIYRALHNVSNKSLHNVSNKSLHSGTMKVTIDCSIRDKYGSTFIEVYRDTDDSLISLLLDQNLINFDINAQDREGLTLLHKCVNSPSILTKILELTDSFGNRANPLLTDNEGLKAIDHLAADSKYYTKCAQILSAYAASSTSTLANITSNTSDNEMIKASDDFDFALKLVQEVTPETLRSLILRNIINPNIRDKKGFTLLERNIPYLNFKVLVAPLSNTFTMKLRSTKNTMESTLDSVATKGCDIVALCNAGLFVHVPHLVEYLKEMKIQEKVLTIDCSIKTKFGTNFLYTAETSEELSLMLDQNLINFNINDRDNDLETILHFACINYTDIPTLLKLLDRVDSFGKKADLSLSNDEGCLPEDVLNVTYMNDTPSTPLISTSNTSIRGSSGSICKELLRLRRREQKYLIMKDRMHTLTNELSSVTRELTSNTRELVKKDQVLDKIRSIVYQN